MFPLKEVKSTHTLIKLLAYLLLEQNLLIQLAFRFLKNVVKISKPSFSHIATHVEMGTELKLCFDLFETVLERNSSTEVQFYVALCFNSITFPTEILYFSLTAFI